MSSTLVVVIVVVVLVVLVAAAALYYASRRRALQQRFGPEYDRAVAEGDSRLAAERELRERERKHAQLQLRELDPESRQRYTASWEQIQAKFLDEPNAAVSEADELVTQLIAERGYPTANYDEQLANLSVEHARTLGHYRDAHEIYLVNDKGEATTEQLRQALVHYRELFGDLLGTDVRRTGTTTNGTTTTPTARTDEAGYVAERDDADYDAHAAHRDDPDYEAAHAADRDDPDFVAERKDAVRDERKDAVRDERAAHETTNRS